MKIALCLTVLITSILLGSCATKTQLNVSPNLKKHDPKIFAILPFSANFNIRGSQASDIVTDSFETAFISTGYRVVERNKLNKVLDEIKFSYGGNFAKDNLKEIGKMTNADVVIFGMIREFSPYSDIHHTDTEHEEKRCTKISFSFKAVHIESGEIVIKGSVSKEAGFSLRNAANLSLCKVGLPEFSDTVTTQLVAKLLVELESEPE